MTTPHDHAAAAAAEEIVHFDCEYRAPTAEQLTTIIARHYAPLTQAAKDAERALEVAYLMAIVFADNYRRDYMAGTQNHPQHEAALDAIKAALAGIRLALGKS